MPWKSLRFCWDQTPEELSEHQRDACALVDEPSDETSSALEVVPAHQLWFGLATLERPRLEALGMPGSRALSQKEFKLELKRVRQSIAALGRAKKELESVRALIANDYITDDYKTTSTPELSREECRLEVAIRCLEDVLIPDFQGVLKRQEWHRAGSKKRFRALAPGVAKMRSSYWGVIEAKLKGKGWKDEQLADIILASTSDFLEPPCPGFVASLGGDYGALLDRLRFIRRDMKEANAR